MTFDEWMEQEEKKKKKTSTSNREKTVKGRSRSVGSTSSSSVSKSTGTTSSSSTNGRIASFDEWYEKNYELTESEKNSALAWRDDEIAPVAENPSWFQKGAFSDGYQFGDLTKTILGTLQDVNENITTAVFDATENLIDTTAYGVGLVGGLFDDDFQDDVGKFIAKEILTPKESGEAVATYANPIGWTNLLVNGGETEENSVLGDKSDGLVQSGAHLVGSYALQAVGVPAWLTMGVNAFGSEIESAFQQGATFGEAGISGGISAAAEIAFERISSGINISGGSTLDDFAQTFLRDKLKSKIGRTVAKFAVDAVGEAGEEVLTELTSAVGRKFTYMDDKEWNEVISKEELFDAAIGGAVMGSIANGVRLGKSSRSGRDFVTELTNSEEKVVNKLYEETIAEREKAGTKLTTRQKNKIWDGIVEQMEKGQLDIDTIESTLGGDTYNAYKNTVDSEEALKSELAELQKMEYGKMNDIQHTRLNELKGMNLEDTTKRDDLRAKLDNTISPLIEGSKLTESYKERARKGQAFEADLTQYTGKQKEAVERAIKSGVLNNTYRSHELVDVLSKIEADKGIVFDYTNNAKLKESGFAVEGKTVNGFEKNGTVTLNVQSAKSWQSVVGHEITHVLEGTDAYSELRNALYAYAESKGELASRKADLTALYTGIDADIDAELTADLVGDYLFTDSDFIKNLTSNRNLFQKIYDEIKYLCKVATGKELTEIEKVKREFDRAWKEYGTETKQDAENKSGVEFDEASESYSPVGYSISSWSESDYVTVRQKAAEDMAKTLGVTTEKASKYIDDVNSIAKMIADDKARLSYEPSPDRSAFVSNSEYGGSIDFSTICKKRRLFTGTFEAIQNALPNTALTAEEVLEIRKMMKDKGYEVSCGLCYVEGSRANMGQYTKQFIERYKATNPEYVPNMAEMNTATGQEQIRKEHPEVYEAYEYFMNHYGRLSPTDKALFASQQKPKMYQMSTDYKGEILDNFGKNNGTVEAKNKNGGLRLQSFSDFEVIHLIDSMQVIMDMSRVGLAGQAYTKVPDFAWALGDTGLKINLSLIAKGVDENGRLVLDEVEGMSEADAMALRDRYSDNVGTILVAFNDEQLKAAMADERIDYIIPYHRSQWKTNQYEAMGLPENTKDYTNLQNESYIEPVYNKNGKKQRPSNYMPNNYWDFSKSGKENAEAYLKMCAENNRKPKFSHLLVDNHDGSYSLQPDGSTDGYWKTLIDFKMYNNDGVGVPQNPVTPDFNMEEAQRMLNEYTGGHQKFPVAKDVVEAFVAKHPDNIAPTDVKYSISSDSDYLKAVESGDTETAQMMVDEAAKNAGYTEKLYHGTNKFGFTKIDGTEGYSYDEVQFFTTDSLETANTYSGTEKVRRVAEKHELDYDIEDEYEGKARDIAFDMADYMSRTIGYRGYIEGDYIIDTIKNGKGSALLDIEDNWLFDIYQNEYSDEYEEFYEFEESKECEQLSTKFHNYSGQIESIYTALETYETSGIYEFWANTDNLFVIDGKGKHWNALEDSRLPDRIVNSGGKDIKLKYKTRDVCLWAKKQGYKGVLFKDIVDSGSGQNVSAANVYAFFDPRSQVKSADPITYDDNGNVIPLSQRFNTANEDMRYSVSNEGEEYAPTGNFSTPLKELALEDVAPATDTNVPTNDVAEDIAPMTEETVDENPLPTNATSEEIIKTIKDRLSAKVANSTKQLEKTKLLRDRVRESYAHKIEKLQATYDSKKNKDTKVAVGIQRRISNLQRVAADLDADLAKRISDIESRISNTSERLQDPQKKDILEIRYERINKHLEADKASLKEAFDNRRAELERNLADKSTYFSNKAHVLYNEVKGMKKGVRVSEELGYLLDNLDLSAENKAASYKSLRTALLNIKNRPNSTVNQNSEIESIAREMLAASYENDAYDLADMDNQYQAEAEKLEADAQKQRDAAREEESALRRGDVRNAKIAEIESILSSKGFNLDSILDNPVRQLSTLETVDTMPQRVMEKTFGYEAGQALADATVNKVALNESEGIKWLDSITNRKGGLLAQLSKQYNIKPESKEIQAAQMYAEGSWVNEETDEEFAYGDAELAKDFPDVKTQNNIKALVRDPRIRQFYDETLDMINEARKRNGYPEIPKRNNYYLHYREMGDFFTKNGLPFNPNDMRAKDLPTDMVGRTADLKPGQPYFTSSMQRKGKKTSYNLFEGMERYANSAKNQIFHLDDIQTLRALHYHLAERFGQAQGLENLNSLTPEQASERIKQVYGSHLSTFAAFLDTEANILAGKTSMIDRAFSEGILGRRILTFMDALNKHTGAAMIGYNVSSANTNWLPVVREFANANPVDSVKALAQTVANIATRGKLDSFREDSSVYIRRRGADRFNRKFWQKLQDPAYALMGAVDSISTEIIARTEYNKAIRNGMSEQEAHYEADKKTSRLMADRSLGQMPQMYTSRIMGLVTKFQLELRNDLDSMFYDTLQEEKLSHKDIENNLDRNAKTAAKVAWRYGATAVALHMFGQAFESIAGYNPAFDIIEAISKAFGWDDEEDDEDTWRDNLGEGAMSLIEDLPYASIFLDGGRIPVASALPDFKGIITGEDEYGNEKTLGDSFLEIAPYMLPAGGNQIKKTYQGLKMFSDEHPVAGSYTDSGNLRFPVEDTPLNRVQAGIFGQYASENAREYFDNGYAPLKEKQIQEYIDVELPIADYWDYREGLSGLKTTAEKADYINSLDIEDWQKNLLMNNILDRKEDVDMSNYDDYSSWEEFDYAVKNPEKYAIAKAVGGYTSYKTYSDELYDIRADKDENGKSISGSRKEKVINYVNNLDVDYGTRLILFKSEYPSDDTYNEEIIKYLDEREDITYEEMVTILTELGFKVHNDTVYWD